MPSSDEDDGGNDYTHGENHPGSDQFAGEQPSEKHSDNRIHVGVGGSSRWCRCSQEPDIGGESDEGTKNEQVQDRNPRANGGMSQVDRLPLARQESKY